MATAPASWTETELDFNGQGAFGLGPLSYEAQRGMYLHPTYAVTPARAPLGIIDAWMWARHGVKPRGIDAPDGVKPIEWRLLRLVGVKLLWIQFCCIGS